MACSQRASRSVGVRLATWPLSFDSCLRARGMALELPVAPVTPPRALADCSVWGMRVLERERFRTSRGHTALMLRWPHPHR